MLDELNIEITRKRIKCLRIAVYPGDGRVRVSAPLRATDAAVRTFVESKIDWIRKHLSRGGSAPKTPVFEYVSWEEHPLFWKPCRLEVSESASPEAGIKDGVLFIGVSKGSAKEYRKAVLDEFYREELKKILPAIMARREAQMGVKAAEWRVRKMKTKWGTCNVRDRRIWFSTELAKKPLDFVEYVAVHELAHLIERGHGPKFKAVMDRFYPGWRGVE